MQKIPCLLKCNLPRALKKEESDLYVSYCPVLDLYSQGGTEKEAKNNIIEAVGLFIQTACEAGTLKDVLADCGFSFETGASRNGKNENLIIAVRRLRYQPKSPWHLPKNASFASC